MTAHLAPARVAEQAGRLLDAGSRRVPIPPLTDDLPGLTVDDAYAIQEAIVAHRRAAGERIVGWKLGLTSRAMQEQLGVSEPDYAALLTGHLTRDGVVSAASLIAPRVEAEIAFLLAEPLEGPGVTADDVLRATRGVAASVEIIDSRIEGWRIRLADTIADMASSARIAVSERVVPAAEVRLPEIAVRLYRNDELAAQGAGAAVMGDPAAAVAWAANRLAELGTRLEAGHVVMPGAMHASVAAQPGDRFRAEFDGLGEVTIRFAPEGEAER